MEAALDSPEARFLEHFHNLSGAICDRIRPESLHGNAASSFAGPSALVVNMLEAC